MQVRHQSRLQRYGLHEVGVNLGGIDGRQAQARQLRNFCENLPLNDLGQSVIAELNKLGIVTDFSHMGPTPFEQVLNILQQNKTKSPFILSHVWLLVQIMLPT